MISVGTQILFGAPVASGGMENPMTTAADLIVGGTAGAPARLAKGSALQVLRMNAGATAQEWSTPASTTPTPSWIPLSGTVFTVAALAGGAYPAGINAIGGSPLAIDPASYAISGLTAAFTLCVTGYTDNASRTGTVTLWDLTTDAAVATATFNNAGPTAAAATGVATLNATPHVYEVRLSVSGTLTTHLATVNNVSLRITWS